MVSTAGTTTLSWDTDSRLTGIAYPNSSTNTFVYNGLAQRVGTTDSRGTLTYTLADDSVDSAVLKDSAATYTHGLGLVSEVRSGTSKFYHADALGTTRAMSGSTGSVTDTKSTDAFGNTFAAGSSGTTPTPFGFAGQHGYQSDPDSALMRLGHRYYDSSVGRFLSRDPIQDGYNWYAYCDNDPVNAVDPKGLDGQLINQSKRIQWALGRFEEDGDYTVVPTPPNYTPPPGVAMPPTIAQPRQGRPGRTYPVWEIQNPETGDYDQGLYVTPVQPGGRDVVGGGGFDVEAGWDKDRGNWIHIPDTTPLGNNQSRWDGNGDIQPGFGRRSNRPFQPNDRTPYRPPWVELRPDPRNPGR